MPDISPGVTRIGMQARSTADSLPRGLAVAVVLRRGMPAAGAIPTGTPPLPRLEPIRLLAGSFTAGRLSCPSLGRSSTDAHNLREGIMHCRGIRAD